MNLIKTLTYILRQGDEPEELTMDNKTEVDINLKTSYITKNPFNSLILANLLIYTGEQIKSKVQECIDLHIKDSPTVEYNGSKITLRKVPVYEYDNDKIDRLEKFIEERKSEYKDSIKDYEESIKTIKKQMVESGEAKLTNTKSIIVLK